MVLQYHQQFSHTAGESRVWKHHTTVLFVEVPTEDRKIKSTIHNATAKIYKNGSDSHTHDSYTMTDPQLSVLTSIILQYALFFFK
jgi:hypothetical protein